MVHGTRVVHPARVRRRGWPKLARELDQPADTIFHHGGDKIVPGRPAAVYVVRAHDRPGRNRFSLAFPFIGRLLLFISMSEGL